MKAISDIAIVPLSEQFELVIASDNSGAIGMKQLDEVKVPNEVTSYYACRVAYMDLIRAKGEPKVIVMQNFTGDSAWHEYKLGVNRFLKETKVQQLPITGSTESNFTTVQSGVGLTIIGTRPKSDRISPRLDESASFAVIGKPLVGNQAIEQAEHIAPISLYEKFVHMTEIIDVMPVGSKGILVEWQKLTGEKNDLRSELNLTQSGGPATCFIIAYPKAAEAKIKAIAKRYFHPLFVE